VALHVVLIAAFALGATSVALRKTRLLGGAGMVVVLIATLLGGSRASARLAEHSDVYFGLDFFLLNLILLGDDLYSDRTLVQATGPTRLSRRLARGSVLLFRQQSVCAVTGVSVADTVDGHA
jgi:hypothetical protein